MDYLEDETDECRYCENTIRIKDMPKENWCEGSYYCDSCIVLIGDCEEE